MARRVCDLCSTGTSQWSKYVSPMERTPLVLAALDDPRPYASRRQIRVKPAKNHSAMPLIESTVGFSTILPSLLCFKCLFLRADLVSCKARQNCSWSLPLKTFKLTTSIPHGTLSRLVSNGRAALRFAFARTATGNPPQDLRICIHREQNLC